MADMMQLRQGQRVLDVGCGWGGPLVYLSRRYGVSGIGITPAPRQVEYGKRRADRYGVPVEFRVAHWREYDDPQPFDAVYSDEVIVHFNDLHGYFEKARTLLKPGGVILNKELHFTGQRHMALSRAMVFINKMVGETGNYRTLHEELATLDGAGFDLVRIEQMGLTNYQRTLDGWLANMRGAESELTGLVGADEFRRIRTYLKLSRKSHGGPSMTLDLVLARAPR